MSKFLNHLLCDACWSTIAEQQGMRGRVPVRLVGSPTEPCCRCAAPTSSGIYVCAVRSPDEWQCEGAGVVHAEGVGER